MSFDFAIPMLWLIVSLMVVVFEALKLFDWFDGEGSSGLERVRA